MGIAGAVKSLTYHCLEGEKWADESGWQAGDAVRLVLWDDLFGDRWTKDGNRLKVLKAISKLLLVISVENKADLD